MSTIITQEGEEVRPKQSVDPERIEIEFYNNQMPTYEISNFNSRKAPDSFNGECKVRKYKIVVEHIKETDEALLERCLELYPKTTDNHYNSEAITTFVIKNLKITREEFYKKLEAKK